MPFDCSAAEQKANLGTNAKNLLGFWAAESCWLPQAWGDSVKLTYGKGGPASKPPELSTAPCGIWTPRSCPVLDFFQKCQGGAVRPGIEMMDTEGLTRDQTLSSPGKKAPGHTLGDCFYSSAEGWALFSEAPFLMGSEKASHAPAKQTHSVKFLYWKLWSCSQLSWFAATTVT